LFGHLSNHSPRFFVDLELSDELIMLDAEHISKRANTLDGALVWLILNYIFLSEHLSLAEQRYPECFYYWIDLFFIFG
jgi:hypothetical protein